MDLVGACLLYRRCRRRILVALLIRRVTPGPYERPPGPFDGSERGTHDTGGGGWYRPAHRRQDPSVDPREPNGGESSSRGDEHGWANCTMASGAMALDFHTDGRLAKWGGDLRHRQGDQSGGTDLVDLKEAWASYGETLTIRSGSGWEALKDDRADGRFLVVQGSGNVPGAATFDGGHACALGPETNGDGEWLWGDPLAGGWQWVTPGSIRSWMERWSAGLAYAMSAAHPPSTPPPDPKPEPAPPPPGPSYADGYGAGIRDGRALALDAVFGSWIEGSAPPWYRWDDAGWDLDTWATIPIPLAAVAASRTPAAWGVAGWTAALWELPPDPPDPEPLPGFGEWNLDSWPVTWG